MNAGRVIGWSMALAVVGVAVVAAVVSYEHVSALVREHGESGRTGRLIPLTVAGMIYASSMVMLDSARRKILVPALARWLLGLGIVATLRVPGAAGSRLSRFAWRRPWLTRRGRCGVPGTGECSRRAPVVAVIRRRWR
jgi:Protein of unknown function (DUF2637)